jgi:class 3 adenylate cyclase/DNA-binding response OmpR family regulator
VSGETILVIDDSQDNRNLVTEYVLKPGGYNPLVAADGREGLEVMIKHMPDLILLDYNMPRMDGLAVLRVMAKRELDIPVILMTADGSEDLAVEVFRLGARDYIIKPYSVEEMEHAIEKNLTETRLKKEKDALTDRVIQANRELQLRLQELNVFHSIGKKVTSLINMEQLLPRIVDAAIQITRAQQGYVYLRQGDQLVCRAQRLARRSPPTETTGMGNVLAERVIRTGGPIVFGRQQMRKLQVREAVEAAYVPITFSNEVIGVLGVENVVGETDLFSQHDSALLSMLADYAAIAISHARNYEALRKSKDQEKHDIRGTFERFVAPSVVEQALQRPELLQLGGNRREISVLFADIRGYTTWSESAEPEQVIETLNHYLSLAAEVILAWEGTLDKFFGDGLMALFNAPNDQPDHIHRAADAALALMKAANEVQALHGHRLSYSIGVHLGEAVVGYIGTDRAMNFTAIGDTVNLAKRLQEYAAPSQVLISDEVVKRLGSLVQANPIGEIKVKGRKQPTSVFELTGLHYPDSGG